MAKRSSSSSSLTRIGSAFRPLGLNSYSQRHLLPGGVEGEEVVDAEEGEENWLPKKFKLRN